MTKYDYLPKQIIKSTELTPAEKIIYLHLFHITGWGDDKTINITHLSEKLGLSIRTVRAAINTKLQDLGYISINEDRTATVYLNGIEIKDKQFYQSKQMMNMLGDFVKVPTQFLYDTNLTPAERLTEMVLFDYYFDIDKSGNFKNDRNVVLKTVAIAWGIKESTFKEHIQSIKAKGAIDYTVHTSQCKSTIYGFKFFRQETVRVYLNGKTQKSDNIVVETTERTIEPTEEEQITTDEYMPTHEEIEERDMLLANIRPIFKREYEISFTHQPVYLQIIWLKQRQNRSKQ